MKKVKIVQIFIGGNAFSMPKTKNGGGLLSKRDFLSIDRTTDYDKTRENKYSFMVPFK